MAMVKGSDLHWMKNSLCPRKVLAPCSRPTDRKAVQTAITNLIAPIVSRTLHYHNFIGNKGDGLLHVFSASPIVYGAIMYAAGTFTLQKGRGKDYQVFSVSVDVWDSIINEHKLGDKVKTSLYTSRKIPLVKISVVNPIVADMSNEGYFLRDDMMTAAQQFQMRIKPPRQNISGVARKTFLETVRSHISAGSEVAWLLSEGSEFYLL